MTKDSLTVVSLNIQQGKHLDKIIPTVMRIHPEVCCFQEALLSSIPKLSQKLELPHNYFIPLANGSQTRSWNIHPDDQWGMLFLSRVAFKDKGFHCYAGDAAVIPEINEHYNSPRRAIAWVKISKFTLLQTHFTWTPVHFGGVTFEQSADFAKLLAGLDQFPAGVLCGDLNSPRGKSLWSQLANRFTDYTPPEIVTTIDPKLHRAGDLKIVVDCVFAWGNHMVTDIELLTGVSDHYGFKFIVNST